MRTIAAENPGTTRMPMRPHTGRVMAHLTWLLTTFLLILDGFVLEMATPSRGVPCGLGRIVTATSHRQT
jgi:hypothetical protein